LLSLIDKSLIVAEVGTAGAERYRLLESLRQYARERLIARRELEQVTCRHAVYFRDRAVEAAPHLLGPDQAGWFDRLERDHDNFRAALRWAIEREDADTGIRLAASLHYFWFLRGHFREGQAIHAAMLDLPAPPHLGALRAELLRGLATLALFEADYARARAFADEGVRLARQAGEPGPLAATLVGLGYVARVQGDYPAARSALEEALALAQDAGDSLQRAMALHHLGLLELEDGPALDVALALSQESLALFRQLGNRRFIGNVLAAIARVMRARGDTGAAPTLLLEALTRFVDIGDLGPVPSVLYTLAAAAADEQRLERAVRLQAAATRVEETVGARVWPAYRRERDTWLGRARAELGEAAFGQAWAAGLAMTPEQTLAEALDAPRVET
jgi:tetratricopeptide (TPR) repeat protein